MTYEFTIREHRLKGHPLRPEGAPDKVIDIRVDGVLICTVNGVVGYGPGVQITTPNKRLDLDNVHRLSLEHAEALIVAAPGQLELLSKNLKEEMKKGPIVLPDFGPVTPPN